MVLRFERRPQSCHLIDYATQRPDVTFFVVALFVNLLGTHIVGSTHVCLGKNRVLIHHTRKSKVPHFCIVVCVQKNVSWFQISMENLLGAIQIL